MKNTGNLADLRKLAGADVGDNLGTIRKKLLRKYMASPLGRQKLLASMMGPARILSDQFAKDGATKEAADRAKKMLQIAERLVGRMAIEGEAWKDFTFTAWPDEGASTAGEVLRTLRHHYKKARKSLKVAS